MAKAPAVQNLLHKAASLALEADGSFFFACGEGAYGNGLWLGFGHFEAATRKVRKVEAPMAGPLALLGDELAGVADRKKVTIVDRTTGAVKRSFAPLDFEVMELLASPDAKWLVAFGRNGGGLVLFDAVSGVPTTLQGTGAAFTAPGQLLYCAFEGEQGLLVWRDLSTGKEQRKKWKAVALYGALRLQEGHVFSDNANLVELSTGRSVDLGSGFFSEGAAPGQLVRVTRTGMVEVIDFKGALLRTFARPRRGSIIEARVANGSLVMTNGSYLEVYQLGAAQQAKRAERKAPAKREPVTSPASADQRATGLLEAYFARPDDHGRLAVWADLLTEHGDPRGEFIQLHLVPRPTPAQQKRLEVLRSRGGGAMVGPAREYLRSWKFGEQGLVEEAVVEAPLLAEGLEEIARLNPRLALRVTALGTRTRARVAALSRLKLGRIMALRLNSNSLTDASLEQLAPALTGVKELDLSNNELTAEGLKKVLPHLAGLRELQVDDGVLARTGFRKQLLAALPTLEFLNQHRV